MKNAIQTLCISITFASLGAACAEGTDGSFPVFLEIDHQTTDGVTALQNLDSEIFGQESRWERFPGDVTVAERLVALYGARAEFTGRYSDFDKSLSLVESLVREGVENPEVWFLYSDVLVNVHRFDEAEEAIHQGELLGGQSGDRQALLGIARGDKPDTLLAERSVAAAASPTFRTLSGLAVIQSAFGQFQRADDNYRGALSAYRDISPFPIAETAFQMGVMWGESADDIELARGLYAASVERLPAYVVANVHLAELEFDAGQERAAIARLEAIVDRTEDPEPASRLGEFLLGIDDSLAETYKERARSGYQELLDRHYLAFIDHAAEFYLGAGDDPAQALELALDNLANRPDDRAYQLAIEASIAANSDLTCMLARDARSNPTRVSLAQLLDELAVECALP